MTSTPVSAAGQPLEIERKYLIRFPCLKDLEKHPGCRKLNLKQLYLKHPSGHRLRIRQTEENGIISYFKTEKTDITCVTRVEIESAISEEEFNSLLPFADPERRPVIKTRYCLPYSGHCFEIDIYPFWKNQAVMEVELSAEDEEIRFPPDILIIREVSDEPEYRNSALARKSCHLSALDFQPDI